MLSQIDAHDNVVFSCYDKRIMKFLLPLVVMVCAFSVSGQSTETAATTRASNGQLISLTNIVRLSDCPTRSLVGKVKDVSVDGSAARIGLRVNRETKNIEVHLDRVGAADRAVLFKDLIRKGFTLRIAGYACDSGDKISAFTIDRVYSSKSK